MNGDNRGFGPRRSFAPVRPGDEIDVKIEAVGEKGDGIAKKQGFVLFVPNVKEGDEVRIRITKVLRKVGFAEVIGEAQSKPEVEEKPKEEAEAEPEEKVEDTEDFGEETGAEPEAEREEKKEATEEGEVEEEAPAEEEETKEETEEPAEEPEEEKKE